MEDLDKMFKAVSSQLAIKKIVWPMFYHFRAHTGTPMTSRKQEETLLEGSAPMMVNPQIEHDGLTQAR